jgi:hypothetical protein
MQVVNTPLLSQWSLRHSSFYDVICRMLSRRPWLFAPRDSNFRTGITKIVAERFRIINNYVVMNLFSKLNLSLKPKWREEVIPKWFHAPPCPLNGGQVISSFPPITRDIVQHVNTTDIALNAPQLTRLQALHYTALFSLSPPRFLFPAT